MPQFSRPRRSRTEDIAVGGTLFVTGLVKKVVIADAMAIPANQLFAAAAGGAQVPVIDTWLGVLCYALQIYFDFSAYSDMAVGIARMMGIDFPINFASPYKARSVTDFWRRWHITLSRFLRDYLYIPLGGSRSGPNRHRMNLFITMCLGGIWHGAGWTFLVWGALHGTYLLIHQFWRSTPIAAVAQKIPGWSHVAWAATFVAVLFAWVPFRAPDMATTMTIWSSMVGVDGGVSVISGETRTALFAGAAAFIAFFAPNAYEVLAAYKVGLPSRGYPATQNLEEPRVSAILWRPSHAIAMGILMTVVVLKLYDASEFIYFQF
jgi:D-alanyl-lipoteichoic acid acyltransferase DltB (MBOAT superfamily)